MLLRPFEDRVAIVKGVSRALPAITMRLVCPRCDAGLVPSWSGLRCPRMSACGMGGPVEVARTGYVFVVSDSSHTGVKA